MNTAPEGGVSRPTAGALRLVESGSEAPRSVDVRDYVEAMARHCPFLGPSRAGGMTVWAVYEIVPGASAYAVEAELFHGGVRAAERLRSLTGRSGGALACENVVIMGENAGFPPSALMAWPHWALKNLYGPVGVMFGKFAEGGQERDRRGRSVPPSPFSFLSVRAAVRGRDPWFLKDTPVLAEALATAEDDGRDVFADVPCDWKAVRAWARSLPAPRTR
ncbi:hypothetical protein JNUCC64_22635 [Streptomyces sp. JNUCC 64]